MPGRSLNFICADRIDEKTCRWNDTNIAGRLENGASILNIACGHKTPEVVRKIRAEYPHVPLIASGGKSNETVHETIAAGANAITYTPPSAQELFKTIMAAYRE